MKNLVIGFILGVMICILMGSSLYHPVRGVIVRTESKEPTTIDLKAIMRNQEAIYNLIKNSCMENEKN